MQNTVWLMIMVNIPRFMPIATKKTRDAIAVRFFGTNIRKIQQWPLVGCSKPANIRSEVVLPQPDGPSKVEN